MPAPWLGWGWGGHHDSTKVMCCGGAGAAWVLMEKRRAGMPEGEASDARYGLFKKQPRHCLAGASCSVVTPFEAALCLPSVQNILLPWTAPRCQLPSRARVSYPTTQVATALEHGPCPWARLIQCLVQRRKP